MTTFRDDIRHNPSTGYMVVFLSRHFYRLTFLCTLFNTASSAVLLWLHPPYTLCTYLFSHGRGGGVETWTKELKDTNPLMSSLLVICLGFFSNFAGSESGQKQSVKLLQNMVYSTIQHTPTPPVTHTVCINSTFSLGRGGGGQREGKVEGQQYTSIVSIVPTRRGSPPPFLYV